MHDKTASYKIHSSVFKKVSVKKKRFIKTYGMKTKVLFLMALVFISSLSLAQRGVRIGYIDTEYILENVPEYQDAQAQLENKVQKWKADIEKRLGEVEQKKKDLKNESVLLTKELIEEREEDIKFEEDEILEYQQKRFGPNGDLILQKKQLMQPIQDQIFAAVQDIAKNKQFDFVFDKSADVVMLYSSERFDISDQVLRVITRASKRKQAQSRQERKQAENEEVVPEINKELDARQKEIERKRSEREKAAEERRQQILAEREAKKKAAEERRQKILEERQKAREAKLNERAGNEDETNKSEADTKSSDTKEKIEEPETKTREQILEERRQQKLKEREARQKALEERKRKILEEREKARQERLKKRQNQDNETENDQQDG